jgi:glyoxylase-like metal-dependent hydrolase (beta-lactamase superfamily II)
MAALTVVAGGMAGAQGNRMQVRRIGALSAEVVLGDLSVIALSDGQTSMPATHLRGEDGQPLPATALGGADLVDGKLRLQVSAFAVRGPDGCLLIDAGAGTAWHKTLGLLPQAMAEAGIAAADITTVALTHTHIDHIGGLVSDEGVAVFPNAEIFVPEAEMGLFRAETRMAPVLARAVMMQPGEGVMPGVMAIAAPGHEVGHTAFLVGGRLLICGDLLHHPAIQFARPAVTWAFDTQPAQARTTRLSLLARAASESWPLAGAHLAFPGIGRISVDGEGYAFHPIIEKPDYPV